MDSTTVSLISQTATQLGVTAATAFGWYLTLKIGETLVWALFWFFFVLKAADIAQSIGWGMRLVGVVKDKYGSYPDSLRYEQAMSAIRNNQPK